MPKTIMLTSTKSRAGKTIVAIGMFLKFKEEGRNPGYFKPIGDAMSKLKKSRTDKDVSVISAVVARKWNKDEICPYFLNPEYYLDEVLPNETEQIFTKIKNAYQSIASDSEIMIIEGNHYVSQYSPVGLDDLKFAKEFNASMIICAPIIDDNDINEVISTYEYIKSQKIDIIGIVLNARSLTAEARIKRYHTDLLEKRGINVIGTLKKSGTLEKPTIAEIMDATGAKLYSGNFIKVKNNLIGSFVIAAMGAKSALKILRANVDKCVITGGDRTELAIEALNTSTKLIIFTGNLEPVQRVVSIAEEKEIPLLTVSSDTFTVAEKIRKIKIHIQASEIQICRDMVDNLKMEEF